MRFAFRVDASLRIGNGHMMRCIALAQTLRAHGAQCEFICRVHPGDLIEMARTRGFVVHPLTAVPPDTHTGGGLGCDWPQDAAHTQAALGGAERFDWLIVDHYGIDHGWESVLHAQGLRLMAIDDLADRRHACDLLLDQNLGRSAADYAGLVPDTCTILAGPTFALLDPTFAERRPRSLARRSAGDLTQLLVSMGGVDAANATGRVLSALAGNACASCWHVNVVMGPHAPMLGAVRRQAQRMPIPTALHVGIGFADMADLMAASDLAIGGAGGTAWERCCLGLPTLLVVLAENQRAGAQALEHAAAATLIGDVDDIAARLPAALTAMMQPAALVNMSAAASAVADGLGAIRVAQRLAA